MRRNFIVKFLQEELQLEESEVCTTGKKNPEEGTMSTNSPFDMTGLNKLLNLITNSREAIQNYKILHKNKRTRSDTTVECMLSAVVYTDTQSRLLYSYTHM